MGYNNIEWRDSFNIGVEVIDKAHRELFSIIRKLIDLSKDDMSSPKSRRACVEGIKFFKNYVIEHFSQEEEYMRSVKYKHYLAHKRRHDIMRYDTIPALEQRLNNDGFSRESIEYFYDVCIGWLTTHIAIEDVAIIKNYDMDWKFDTDHAVRGIEKLFKDAVQELFKSDIYLADSNYQGNPLERPICMEFIFKNTEGKRAKILFVVEERLVTSAVAKLIGVQFVRINDISLTANSEIMLSVIQRVAPKAKMIDGTYQLLSECRISAADVQNMLNDEYFRYKLLFGSDDGNLAFCFSAVNEQK